MFSAALLQAVDLTLSPPTISRNGNVSLEVRGTPGSSVVFEVSSGLSHWVSSQFVVLTNGSALVYLRPSVDNLFCRVRSTSPQELPKPTSFAAVPNSDFIRSAFFLEVDGSLSLKDDNGYSYVLTVTQDSLLKPESISIQVVNETSGLPAGMTYLAGAVIQPGGLDVFDGVNLGITLPAGADTSSLAAIGWKGVGEELHFIPFSVTGQRVNIPVRRLGGFGLVKLNGGDISSVTQSRPTDPLDQFDHQISVLDLPAGSVVQPRQLAFSRQGANPCLQVDAWMAFVVGRRNALEDAITDDSILESTLHEYSRVDQVVPLLSNPCYAPLATLIDQCDGLAIRALMASVEREAGYCKSRKDLRALVRLYRDGRLAKRGRWKSRLSAEEGERITQLFHECLNFKVELLSSTATSSSAGTVRTSVSSTIRASWKSNFDPITGEAKFRVAGDSELTIDSTQWDNPRTPCTASAAPASGRITVQNIGFVDAQVDVQSVIIRSDEELPTPRLELYFDPFLPPASENYTLTCPPAPPVVFQSSFWGAAFGALHQGEIQKLPDKHSVFVIRNFRSDGPTKPVRADYQSTGKADALDVSETTSFFITYLGGS